MIALLKRFCLLKYKFIKNISFLIVVADNNIVQKGDHVYLHFVSKLEDGTTISSSLGKQPMQFTVGAGEVIHGLDVSVEGMKLGERKTLIISPEDAFGSPTKELISEIPRYAIKEVEPHVGMEITMKAPNGRIIHATITEVKPTTIVVDANHPLAGKTIMYEVMVMKIN